MWATESFYVKKSSKLGELCDRFGEAALCASGLIGVYDTLLDCLVYGRSKSGTRFLEGLYIFAFRSGLGESLDAATNGAVLLRALKGSANVFFR